MNTQQRYVPDLAGYPFAEDPQGGAVLRRNLEMIASALSRGAGTTGAPAIVVNTPSGGGSGRQTPHDQVLTRHLSADWLIYERVAVTRIVQENATASIIFADADTVLVEIGG